MEVPIMDAPFELQHLEWIAEFIEALFPSHLKASYRVNCLDGSRVHCDEVLKAMFTWSGS